MVERFFYPSLPSEPYDHKWEYVQRRTMQEIVPNLYLGPYAAACTKALENMLKAGLTHIVCVRHETEKVYIRPNHPAHFTYMVVPIQDTLEENILPYLNAVIDFITEAIDHGGKVLVHGNVGASRSAALVIAFLMNKYGATAAEALDYVQKKRFCVNVNENFLHQLKTFEDIYRARHRAMGRTTYAENPDPERFSIKRRHSDDEDEYEDGSGGPGSGSAEPTQKMAKVDGGVVEAMDDS